MPRDQRHMPVGAPLQVQYTGARDPFAWREALTPPGISPIGSTRTSRAGSRACSVATTPRSITPPPLSPARTGSDARSSRSGHSALYGAPQGELSARSGSGTGNFMTPEPSARSSDFMSAYDAHTGRTHVDFSTLHEGGEHGYPSAAQYAQYTQYAEDPRRHRTFAAAFTAFTPAEEEHAFEHGAAASAAAPDYYAEAPDDKKVFSAARHGRHKEVEAALVEGFDPLFVDTFGNTIFHIACQNGNKRIAKLAIKYGGDMDAQNLKGNTGLHFLFAYGYPEIAEYFIEKGADEMVINEVGKTAREGIR